MKFGYKETRPGVYQPILEIHIETMDKEDWIPTSLLVDSGADMTLIDKKLAKVIGVDLEKCEKGETAWGIEEPGRKSSKITYQAVVNIRIPDGKKTSRSIPSTVAFVDLGDSFGVLGQIGFFEHHVVCFDTRKKKFFVDEED